VKRCERLLKLDSDMFRGISQGWQASLKTLLETGEPLPMTTRRWGKSPERVD